jgi:RHS repeat-associated protein
MNMKGLESQDVQTVQNKDEHLWQYNGKERQDDFNLFWADYGARNYDAQVGRWHSVDPLAEKFNAWSPFNYVLNNPIRLIDPDGKAPTEPPKKVTKKHERAKMLFKFNHGSEVHGQDYIFGNSKAVTRYYSDDGSITKVDVTYTEASAVVGVTGEVLTTNVSTTTETWVENGALFDKESRPTISSESNNIADGGEVFADMVQMASDFRQGNSTKNHGFLQLREGNNLTQGDIKNHVAQTTGYGGFILGVAIAIITPEPVSTVAGVASAVSLFIGAVGTANQIATDVSEGDTAEERAYEVTRSSEIIE